MNLIELESSLRQLRLGVCLDSLSGTRMKHKVAQNHPWALRRSPSGGSINWQ